MGSSQRLLGCSPQWLLLCLPPCSALAHCTWQIPGPFARKLGARTAQRGAAGGQEGKGGPFSPPSHPSYCISLGICRQACSSCCTTGTFFLRIYVASHHGEQQTQSCRGGEGEGDWVCPRRQQRWLWRGLPSGGGRGAIFLSSVLSRPHCCFDSCINLFGDFPAPSPGDGKFSAAPSPRPGADHLWSGLFRPGGAGRWLCCLAPAPGWQRQAKGPGGLGAALTLPAPCLALVPGLLGREKRAYPAAHAVRAPIALPSTARSCSS